MKKLIIALLLITSNALAASIDYYWGETSSGVTSYQACQATYSGNTNTFNTANATCQTVTTIPTASAPLIFTNLNTLYTYYFRVRALTATQTTAWSTLVTSVFIQPPVNATGTATQP